MFGRRKAEEAAALDAPERPGAKGRPTPKRSVSEAANKRPLVPSERDRKGAARASRVQLREQRVRQRQAMMTGDERHLPARDAGPQRRFVRDYIDARFNIGEFMLPLIALVFGLTLIRVPSVILAATLLVYVLILAALVDAFLVRRRLRQLLTKKFGEMQRGSVFYAVTRSLQIRRWRLPRPMVQRGEYPS
jgi:Flp pilus assembly protein TadB